MESTTAHAGPHSTAHANGGAQAGHDDGGVHAHLSSAPFYWGIFGALVVLTIITWRVSYFDFGAANVFVALLIATAKASLVAAFFMHLRYDSLFNTVAFLAAFLFLGLFILLTYDDLGKRAQVDPEYGGTVLPETGQSAPGGLPATTATANEAEREQAPPGKGVGKKAE